MRCPPKADSADVEGTITIRPLGQRIIRYELSFLADDGKRYEMVGQKDISLAHGRSRPLRRCPPEILDEDHRRVATCLTRFDYRNDCGHSCGRFRPA